MFSILQPIQTRWERFRRWVSKLVSVDPDLNTLPSLTEEPVRSLPADIEDYLQQQIDQISPPEPYLSAISTALTESLDRWNSGLTNALVLLSSTIEDLPKTLEAALAHQLQSLGSVKVWTLSWQTRSIDHQTLAEDLHQTLEKMITAIQIEVEENKTLPLVIIPYLEQCFLRYAEGLEAVELLTQTVAAHPEYFWLVGCNEWAWAYLSRVCQLSAYFKFQQSLPTLDGELLEAWLTQEIKTVNVVFDEAQIDPVMGASVARKKTTAAAATAANFFTKIATLAEGLAPTAAQLWLKSLEMPDSPSHPRLLVPPTQASQVPAIRTELRPGAVSLPKLPALNASERYLLHAVLLHGTIALPHLVLSLADPLQQVQAQLQPLLQAGILQNRQGVLSVNPLYYPQIKADLKRNNFLLEPLS